MKIIIMGCGRVGEEVSRLMAREGHDVAVIDYNGAALARLGPDFKGRKIKGLGFDRKVLIDAGIERAEAFAVTSSSDNANIIAARRSAIQRSSSWPRTATAPSRSKRWSIPSSAGAAYPRATAWRFSARSDTDGEVGGVVVPRVSP
jgi:voltage-gated potassium channel Kch